MTMEQCLADLGSCAELLSDRQRDELRGKGYTLLPGVIDAGWLAELRERFESWWPRRARWPAWRCTRRKARAGWRTW